MKKYMFIFGNNRNDLIDIMFNDLKEYDSVIFETAEKITTSNISVIKRFQHIYSSYKLNKIIKMPFSYRFCKISEFVFDENDEYYVIVMNQAFWTYDYFVYNELAKKSNVHLSCLLIDSYGIVGPVGDALRRQIEKVKWDYILTYDKSDSEKYGFTYINEYYYSDIGSKVSLNKSPEHDVFFLGRLKNGREQMTLDLYNHLISNDINSDFWIMKTPSNDKMIQDGKLVIPPQITTYDKEMQYIDCLNMLQNSKCIIEIVQENQLAQTLRYFEAVIYNKKLLTNNPNVVNLKYYNPLYIQCFNDIKDIDVAWIKEDIEVDYNYQGDFSPVYLLEMIDSLYENG